MFIDIVDVRIEELIVNDSAADGSPRTLNMVELIVETVTVPGNT